MNSHQYTNKMSKNALFSQGFSRILFTMRQCIQGISKNFKETD